MSQQIGPVKVYPVDIFSFARRPARRAPKEGMAMFSISRLGGIVIAALFALMFAVPANAQATRTWISGVGDDANPCSRTAPCKTFAGAISKTATGGEIDCLDPGGFGAVTVTKSITLDCGGGIGGMAGSILASGTNGININAASVIVKVRNMTINGIQASGSGGLSGIRFLQGSALIVEHVGIFGFAGTQGSNAGIDFQPGASGATGYTAKLSTLDVEVQYGTVDGILIKPANGCSVIATLKDTSSLNNASAGIRVDSSQVTTGNGSKVTIVNGNFSENGSGIIAVTPAGTVAAAVYVTNSVAAGNTSAGVLATGANAYIALGGNTISGNTSGILALGGSTVKSFGTNYVVGNTTNGTPTAPNLTTL